MTALDPGGLLADAERTSVGLATQLDRQRTTGMAVGMVVERLRMDVDHAEQLLQALADASGRDVLDLARELVVTGRLSD